MFDLLLLCAAKIRKEIEVRFQLCSTDTRLRLSRLLIDVDRSPLHILASYGNRCRKRHPPGLSLSKGKSETFTRFQKEIRISLFLDHPPYLH
jgi:hypothetical protein